MTITTLVTVTASSVVQLILHPTYNFQLFPLPVVHPSDSQLSLLMTFSCFTSATIISEYMV